MIGVDGVIYARVSTQDQDDGLRAQVDICQKYLVDNDHSPDRYPVYRERISAGAPLAHRSELFAAVNRLPRHGMLLIAKRDRLARDPIHAATIESIVRRRKGRVVSAAGEGTEGDSPADVLMRRLIDAFAEYERLLIGDRTRVALAAKKARGEVAGNIPFGFQLADDGVHIEPNPYEQSIVGWVVYWRQHENCTQEEIARRLHERGYRTRNRRHWTQRLVSNLLSSMKSQPPVGNPAPAGGGR